MAEARLSAACRGPVPRRSILEAGLIGASGLSLADLLRLRAAAAAGGPDTALPNDTAVIFIWLPGGFPHLETYDMKPAAPSEYRGEFKPI
ncbi:MAG: DUF1501 domain-containing protein, partial [Planctomycetia bacterium]